MTKEDLITQLHSVFLDVINMHSEEPISAEKLTPTADFYEDIGIDSLLAVALIVEVQRTFKVKLPDADVKDLRSLEKVSDFLLTKMKG